MATPNREKPKEEKVCYGVFRKTSLDKIFLGIFDTVKEKLDKQVISYSKQSLRIR